MPRAGLPGVPNPMTTPHSMSIPERLEAVGQRGEACIILASDVTLPNGSQQKAYTLATGERLKPTEDPSVFETVDGRRRFRLRE